MAEVKVIEAFRDREADLILRQKDEVLTVSEKRANKLIGLGLVKVVEEKVEAPAEPKKHSTKKDK